jgi:hypothetical protein
LTASSTRVEALGGQVVDFLGADIGHQVDEGGLVEQVSLVEADLLLDVGDTLEV